MVRKFCNVTPWCIFCGVISSCLFVLVSLVVHRNMGAARARRAITPLIAADFSPDPYAFTTEKLPIDSKLMCSIGNGHVATDIFSDTVYMNGLYNGQKGESHRARVPAWCNVRLNSTLGRSPLKPRYTLDTHAGAFFVQVEKEWSVVHQRIYAHRFYTRAIINQILISAKYKSDIWRDHKAKYIELSFLPGPNSEDIDFETPHTVKVQNRTVYTACGKTMKVEDEIYQEHPSEVCAFWTQVPTHLAVPRRGRVLHTFVMTLDQNREIALREMNDVLQETEDNLYDKHQEGWKKIYENDRVEVSGNLEMEKIVNGIWYYLMSSLPSLHSNQPHGLFYGLSPCGLSRGALLKDYEGHNFWDTEIWMFPSILLFKPTYAEILLRYRIAMIGAAHDLARSLNYKGVRFPWESAFTGTEVTQPCCPEIAEFEHHITGCIAFAARQYIAMTENVTWLKNGGCAMIFEIADFWASRVKFNHTTGFYDIDHVMGPDEDHSDVNNSVFTNVIAGYALYLGQYATCLCKNFTLPKQRDWEDIAPYIALLYDPVLDYHPQFEGYSRLQLIKQADVTLLGFPLQYKMNISTLANDLTYYENVTRESGPAMTWSMHAISHLRIGNSNLAAEFFNKSYQSYVREPFKIWAEYRKPRIGSVNFLTGMGGFMQAILFGYGGISIHLDRLEIISPRVLPQTSRLKINGIKYLGSDMSLDIHQTNTTLIVTSVDKDQPLELVLKSNKIALQNGITIILYGKGPFKIMKRNSNNCPLPDDLIGMKKSDQINRL